MMLRLLTDEHVSPIVADRLNVARPDIAIASTHRWREGAFLGRADFLLLSAAADDGLTLITYDQKTIPPLLAEMALSGRCHAGVIFADRHTIAPNDDGNLMRAIIALHDRCRDWDWADRIGFLDREHGARP
jgi:hypothetical protein